MQCFAITDAPVSFYHKAFVINIELTMNHSVFLVKHFGIPYGLSRQNRSPLKLVQPDRFWQKNQSLGPLLLPKLVRPDQFWLPKMVPSCQNQSPMGDRFWQKLYRSPMHKVALFIFCAYIHMHGYMNACSYSITIYLWLSN